MKLESPLLSVPGLNYFKDFITPNEETELVRNIEDSSWDHTLKRRVQHYGYAYDYKNRTTGAANRLGDLPDWLEPVLYKLKSSHFFSPNQVIVNEYLPGQGIAPHIDCMPCFGPKIASLSLLSPIQMDFKNDVKLSHMLDSKSLLMFEGPARNLWTHGIAGRIKDRVGGIYIPRQRRISITFRTVVDLL